MQFVIGDAAFFTDDVNDPCGCEALRIKMSKEPGMLLKRIVIVMACIAALVGMSHRACADESSRAAEGDQDAVRVQLHLNRTEIYQFEPVEVFSTFVNTGSDSVTLTASEWVPWLQIQTPDGTWHHHYSPGPHPTPISEQRLIAAGSKVAAAVIVEGGYFKSPGVYHIKAKWADNKTESAAQRIVVRAAEAGNEQAAQKLLEHEAYNSFTYIGASVGGAEHVEALVKFTQRFEQSHYLDWCRLGLLFVKETDAHRMHNGSNFIQVRARLVELQREYEQLAATAIAPVAAESWYHSGCISLNLREQAKAESAFKKALASDASKVIAWRVKWAIETVPDLVPYGPYPGASRLVPSDPELRSALKGFLDDSEL